jgi:hypothetical protein
MKYKAPYGSSDPDASYVDRSTPDSRRGSVPPGKAVEAPQREIVNVIVQAGLTPDENDNTQLWAALKHFFSQVPFYPECTTSNGKFDVSQPSAGTIRVPAGVTWTMRGARSFSTTEAVNLTTLANKTYHLRWTETLGFHLKDLANTSYNSSGSPADETLAAFDSSYDDVLVARVVTNGSNVATITNLINKTKLAVLTNKRLAVTGALNWTVRVGSAITLDWARTPEWIGAALAEFRSNNLGPNNSATDASYGIIRAVAVRVSQSAPPTRYSVNDFEYYYEDSAVETAPDGLLTVQLNAEAK